MLIRISFVFLSAVLTYFSFPNILFIEGVPVLAWGALVPFLVALYERPFRERLALGCWWGVLTFGLLTRWMMDVGVGGYLLFAAALSLSPVIFSLLAAGPFRTLIYQAIWWPCAWVISEGLRSLILGGFTWSLAYSQAAIPAWIQAASFGGVCAVVWIVVSVNSFLCLALKTRGNRRKIFFLAAGLVFIANWSGGCLRLKGNIDVTSTVRLALIQPDISRAQKTNGLLYDSNIARHLVLTEKAARYMPSLFVWPETAFSDDILRDFQWRPQMEVLARNHQAYFLIGSALEKDGHRLNAALLVSPRGEWVNSYTKMKLVPFTEYLPTGMAARWLASRLGITPYNFVAGKGLGIFSLDTHWKPMDPRARRFGVLICSEESYPELVRQLARRQVGFVVSMLNDGWFHHKEALFMHAQNAVFRAVESGISIVRVANTGRTVAFNYRGEVVGDDYPLSESAGFSVIDLPLTGQRTGYVNLGDIFVWLCVGFVIINYIRVFFKESLKVFHS